MNKKGILYGVGVGPGDPELLTLKAIRILNEVDVIFAAASTQNEYSTALSIARPHLKPEARIEQLGFPMTKNPEALEDAWRKNAETVAHELHRGLSGAFLTLGDPLTYSTYGYLQRALLSLAPDTQLKVVPGITSFNAAAAHIGWVLAESRQSLLITSGTADPERLAKQLDVADNAVILKTYKNFEKIRAMLEHSRMADKTVLVSRLGMDGESILTNIAAAPKIPHYLSLALIKKD